MWCESWQSRHANTLADQQAVEVCAREPHERFHLLSVPAPPGTALTHGRHGPSGLQKYASPLYFFCCFFFSFVDGFCYGLDPLRRNSVGFESLTQRPHFCRQ